MKGKFGRTKSVVMLGDLSFVKDWCNKEGLSVNFEKTTFVRFNRKKNINDINDMFLYQEKPKFVKEGKYLKFSLDKS